MMTCSTVSDENLFDQRLDGIVVPTNRSSESFDYALSLAGATNAFLLVLCSGSAVAADVGRRLISYGVRGLAIDVPANYHHPLFLGFETDNFVDAMLGRIGNDISLKRNLGLILGRMAGWNKLLFLDDDIANVQGIDRAISFVGNQPAAGFLVSRFPDNSVVRHAERSSGVGPSVKLTGSALMINLAAVTAFFPRIYNEDWFFLRGIGNQAFCSTAVGTARQKPYDPFKSPSRAASEEFGDLLAEGIWHLTDAGLDYLQSTESDWHHLIAERKSLIRKILKRLEGQMSAGQSDAVMKALSAAEARLRNIESKTCVAYIAAWSHDLELFRERYGLLSYYEASVTQIVEAVGLRSA